MPIISEGSSADVVLSGNSTLTVRNPGGYATVEFPIGTVVWRGGQTEISFDFNEGTARVTAERRQLAYFASADPSVPGLAGAYIKPGTGIPESDLAATVQAKLNAVGGGGSSLPTLIAPVTAIPLDGNKAFNADVVVSATAYTSTGLTEGASCTLVIKGNGSLSPTLPGQKHANSSAFVTTLDAVNNVVVWVQGGRVYYAISQADPVEIAITPVAPAWPSAPAIASATVGVATSYTGAPTGTPTPTLAYQWTLNGANISGATAATYTPISGNAGGALRVVVTATNASGSAIGTSNAVTVAAAATAPAAPAISGATSITATGLTYTWADGANGGSAIISRNADISFDGGTTWAAIATPTVGSNTITFASSGSARTAQIRGRATNSVGAGAYGTLTGIAVPASGGVEPGALPATAVAAQWDLTYSGATASSMDGAGIVTTPGGCAIGKTAMYAGDFDFAWRLVTFQPNVTGGFRINLEDASFASVLQSSYIDWLGTISVTTGGSGSVTVGTTFANIISRVTRIGSAVKFWASNDGGTTYTQIGATVTNTTTVRATIYTASGHTTSFQYRVYAS